jgi:uncharacterized membrane protein
MLAAGVVTALKQFVTVTKLHPILVNFTAALVPVSVGCDLVARLRRDESLRATAGWTLFFATVITPFTAITGWLFWMDDDNGVTGMTIHKWLGTALVVLLFGLFAWRSSLHRRQQWATPAYVAFGAFIVLALIVQGYLGGHQVFSGM